MGPRCARHLDRHVQPATGHRAAAAGLAVVRPGHRQPGVRAGAFSAVAARADHLCRLPGGAGDPAHGRAQLRAAWAALRGAAADPRRAAGDPVRAEDRLGVRLAHPDRRRAGVRRHLRPGRSGLVHLPEPQRAVYRSGVRRPGDGDRAGPAGGRGGIPGDRAADRAPLGHAALGGTGLIGTVACA
ncbi:hypothetical protein XHV734_4054 [Xanthomonas hortorum pv. vitians]|nr:hypothetical protein XHV734_4054 [Xanthomonas hortorum pv. vitians]